MLKNKSAVLAFFAGILLTVVMLLMWRGASAKKQEEVRNDYYIITNQIRKMNKLVVMEQDFSSMQKTKVSSQLLGGIFPSSEKEIITFTKTNAQVSYDLNKMKIDVDSINRKLIIRELPQPQVRIIPSVEIQSMDDSFFNRFDEEDLRKITSSAKQNAVKTVDQQRLVNDGRRQLVENLNNIFVLAKALNYTIEDQTKSLDQSKL